MARAGQILLFFTALHVVQMSHVLKCKAHCKENLITGIINQCLIKWEVPEHSDTGVADPVPGGFGSDKTLS